MYQIPTQTTLYLRIKGLKKKLNKFEVKKLGQKVKDKYVAIYKKLPAKQGLHRWSNKDSDTSKFVAVYPEEFLPEMDKLILAHCKLYERFKTVKNSRQAKKPKGRS